MQDRTSSRQLVDWYRQQLLRWNPQINLVSRINSEQRVARLIDQAQAGFDCTRARLERMTRGVDAGEVLLNYFDLGSGGGIPGVVWHIRFGAAGYRPETCLFEPRSKRAWFLERLGSLTGMPAFTTICDRWGEASDAATTLYPGLSESRISAQGADDRPLITLISLKALRLTDSQVLAGLDRMVAGALERPGAILIARYHPPEQELDEILRSKLEIPRAGEVLVRGRLRVTADEAWSEPLVGREEAIASLVFSKFEVSGRA